MGTQSDSTNHIYRNCANRKLHIVPLIVIIFIDKLIKVSKYFLVVAALLLRFLLQLGFLPAQFSFEIIHHIDNVNQFNILHIALFLSIQEYGIQNSTKDFFHFLMNMLKTVDLPSCKLYAQKKNLTRDKTDFKRIIKNHLNVFANYFHLKLIVQEKLFATKY